VLFLTAAVVEIQSSGPSSRHFFVIAITDGRLERVGKKDIEHSVDGVSTDI
jgi:hypothetical protein